MEPDISGNVVVWTCDRLKFYKMIGDVYYETILCKGNTQWYLKIINSYTEPQYIQYSSNERRFKFILCAYGIITKCDIIAVLISNMEVKERNIVKFSPANQQNIIGAIYHRDFEDCDFAVILRFPDVVENVPRTPPITQEQVQKEIKSDAPEIQVIQTDDLSKDFQAMLKGGHFSDLTIKCEENVLKVHKFVMCARSEVFKTMLSSPMQESSLDTVSIDDIDGEVLQSMIQFIYCGQVIITSMDMASGLLYAAEKYQIQSLKTGIIQYLETVLCETNAIEILEMADLYDERFKAEMIGYISKNFNKLKLTNKWKELKSEKPALALAVYSYND